MAAPPVPGNHTAAVGDPKVRAGEARRDENRLDYKRPFDGRLIDRTRSTALYVEACRGGDKGACWLAMTVASAPQLQAMTLLVAANCKAGDIMSCRALPAEADRAKLQLSELPGGAGRSSNCESIEEHTSCDIAVVRQECAAGFAASCREVAMARPYQNDSRELMALTIELASVAVTSGILSDCRLVGTFGNEGQHVEPVTRVCEVIHKWCDGVGARALKAGKKTEARDAYESACQLKSAPEYDCVDLGVMYLDHKLDEPIAGRGQALVDWGCARTIQRLGKEKAEHNLPGCKRAQPK